MAVDDECRRERRLPPKEIAYNDVESVEIGLVVFVGRTRKRREGAVRVDRADESGAGLKARGIELVPDRDRCRRLRRHQQLEGSARHRSRTMASVCWRW